jgi:ribosome-associated translation inhibitor RaiA
MQLRIKTDGIEITQSLRQHIDRRLMLSLGRYSGRIRCATVRLYRQKGPRGAIGMACQVIATLKPSGQVIVEHTEGDLCNSVSMACECASRAIHRHIIRERELAPPGPNPGSSRHPVAS